MVERQFDREFGGQASESEARTSSETCYREARMAEQNQDGGHGKTQESEWLAVRYNRRTDDRRKRFFFIAFARKTVVRSK